MPITLFRAEPFWINGGDNPDIHVQQDKLGNGLFHQGNLMLGRLLSGFTQFEFATFMRFELDLPAAAVIDSAKLRLFADGTSASASMVVKGGFVKPQGTARAWEDAGGIRNWVSDADVPFAQWNDGASEDLTVFQNNTNAFSSSMPTIGSFLTEWSIGDGQSPTNVVTGFADQLDDYLVANESLRGHVVANHIPVMIQLYRDDARIQNSYQGILSAEVFFTGFGPHLFVEWHIGDFPVVEVTSPLNGQSFVQGDSILFEGTAIDTEDGDISSSLDWISLTDGTFQTDSASFSYSGLSVGFHSVGAFSTDSDGNAANHLIGITILANFAPVVTILTPPDPTTSDAGESISFSATSIDSDDGDISSGIVWSSDLDGVIHTGASFTKNDLSIGTHIITATSTDSGALVGLDTVSVIIEIPPLPPPPKPQGFPSSFIDSVSSELGVVPSVDSSLRLRSSVSSELGVGAAPDGSLNVRATVRSELGLRWPGDEE